jgi:type II secretion system (T2SS) protein E
VIALYIRTGTLTSPNEIVPLQIALGMPVRFPAAGDRKRLMPAIENGSCIGAAVPIRTTMSARPPWLPLGAVLLGEGLITAEQLELALLEQEQLRGRLGEILISFGWVTSEQIALALAKQYGIEFVDLRTALIEPLAPALVEPEVAERYQALPVRSLDGGVLLVAIADPTDVGACDELRDLLGVPIQLAVCDAAALDEALRAAYGLAPVTTPD